MMECPRRRVTISACYSVVNGELLSWEFCSLLLEVKVTAHVAHGMTKARIEFRISFSII